MLYVIAALVGLLVLIGIGGLLLAFGRYKNQPEAIWLGKVLIRSEEILQRKTELEKPVPGFEPFLEEARQKTFAHFFDSISVVSLLKFDGIGPVTVERLSGNGYRTVGSLLQADVRSKLLLIPGFGPAKIGEVYSAIHELTKTLADDFVREPHPEYVKLLNLERQWAAEYQQRVKQRATELRNLQILIAQHQKLWLLADQVTFANFLLRKMPSIPNEILNAPLPELPPMSLLGGYTMPVDVPPKSLTPLKAVQPSLFDPSTAAPSASLPNPASHVGMQEFIDGMYAVARFGFLIAKADGKVAKPERKVIRDFLGELYGASDLLARHIDPCVEKVEKETPNKAEILTALKVHFNSDELEDLSMFGIDIAVATGEASHAKLLAVDEVRNGMGLKSMEQILRGQTGKPKSKPASPKKPKGKPKSKDIAAKPTESPQPKPVPPALIPTSAPAPATIPTPLPTPTPAPHPSPDYREILEIEKGVELSVELIRRKFNLLWDRNDPKKVESMGKKFVQLAEETRQSVREAAEKLIAPFGVPLEVPQEAPPTDIRHNPDLDDVFGM